MHVRGTRMGGQRQGQELQKLAKSISSAEPGSDAYYAGLEKLHMELNQDPGPPLDSYSRLVILGAMINTASKLRRENHEQYHPDYDRIFDCAWLAHAANPDMIRPLLPFFATGVGVWSAAGYPAYRESIVSILKELTPLLQDQKAAGYQFAPLETNRKLQDAVARDDVLVERLNEVFALSEFTAEFSASPVSD